MDHTNQQRRNLTSNPIPLFCDAPLSPLAQQLTRRYKFNYQNGGCRYKEFLNGGTLCQIINSVR